MLQSPVTPARATKSHSKNHTQPISMRLASLRIRHYKSLPDVEFADIQPLTVLVGCNDVGKWMLALVEAPLPS